MTRKLLSLFMLAVLAVGCAPKVVDVTAPGTGADPEGFKAPLHRWPEDDSPALRFLSVRDPWEPVNRELYEINATLDKYVMYPAANVYRAFVPAPVRTGVSNALNNLGEVPVFLNCLLQLKMKKAAITFARFLINSTFGVAGVCDLASNNPKLARRQEDVGQTLGVWGFDSGPYFVMPVLGPSNLRDTAGFGGDTLLMYLEMGYIYQTLGFQDNSPLDMTELIVRGLDMRANTAFFYHSTGSPFEYEMVRFIYTKKRELDIGR
ncbi:MAG: VacJ family lipoprotein [Desulfovibrionaceae bacterium]|nr:VacJ family lipoprotein [Desulfovibrionaceae bacterium]